MSGQSFATTTARKDIGLVRLGRIIHQGSGLLGVAPQRSAGPHPHGDRDKPGQTSLSHTVYPEPLPIFDTILLNSFLVARFLFGLLLGHSDSWLSVLLTLYTFGMGAAEILVLEIKGCIPAWRRYVTMTERWGRLLMKYGCNLWTCEICHLCNHIGEESGTVCLR